MSTVAATESWRNVAIRRRAGPSGVGWSAGDAAGGIVGESLAPSPMLATLPITALVVGLASAAVPVSLLIRRVGRRAAFVTGAAVSAGGRAPGRPRHRRRQLPVVLRGDIPDGRFGRVRPAVRFAAAESVDARHTGRAVSLVLVGGIIAGVLGPEIGRRGRHWFGTEFSGAFVIVAMVQLVALALLLTLRIPAARGRRRARRVGLHSCVLRATVVPARGRRRRQRSAIMSFLMTATPISMHVHDALSIDDAAFVIESHVIAMFAPSLLTGWLVDRLGVSRMMTAGALVIGGAIASSASGHTVATYWTGLVLLGLGWNLLFIGATVLLTQVLAPAERFRGQGLNDLAVFGSQALASLASGAVLHRFGWVTMNLMA